MGFTRAAEFNLEDKLKALVHGNSGAGKSHLGASAHLPAIGLCERQAMRTIRRRNPEAGIWIIERTEDLREMISELQIMIAEERCPFDTVVLDSLGEIQQIIKKEILDRAGQKRENLTQQEWGVIIDRSINIARAFRDLPLHVLVLCRSEETFADEGRFVRPSLSGKKLPNDVAGYFNVCGYSYKKVDGDGNLLHRVLFDGVEGFLSKGDPDLDPIEIPHWPAWIRKMYGDDAEGAATDKEMKDLASAGSRVIQKEDNEEQSKEETGKAA